MQDTDAASSFHDCVDYVDCVHHDFHDYHGFHDHHDHDSHDPDVLALNVGSFSWAHQYQPSEDVNYK